ncbi:hypothetical protein Ddc_10810 [Ditylenchus destructor]|nr:hypothetical protein Ddc_10810 [Ditylenchus destructor]
MALYLLVNNLLINRLLANRTIGQPVYWSTGLLVNRTIGQPYTYLLTEELAKTQKEICRCLIVARYYLDHPRKNDAICITSSYIKPEPIEDQSSSENPSNNIPRPSSVIRSSVSQIGLNINSNSDPSSTESTLAYVANTSNSSELQAILSRPNNVPILGPPLEHTVIQPLPIGEPNANPPEQPSCTPNSRSSSGLGGIPDIIIVDDGPAHNLFNTSRGIKVELFNAPSAPAERHTEPLYNGFEINNNGQYSPNVDITDITEPAVRNPRLSYIASQSEGGITSRSEFLARLKSPSNTTAILVPENIQSSGVTSNGQNGQQSHNSWAVSQTQKQQWQLAPQQHKQPLLIPLGTYQQPQQFPQYPTICNTAAAQRFLRETSQYNEYGADDVYVNGENMSKTEYLRQSDEDKIQKALPRLRRHKPQIPKTPYGVFSALNKVKLVKMQQKANDNNPFSSFARGILKSLGEDKKALYYKIVLRLEEEREITLSKEKRESYKKKSAFYRSD